MFAAALYWIDHKPGAITSPTEAISIELLETEVLEAITTPPTLEAAASPTTVQSDPGAATESAASSKAQPVEELREISTKEPAIAEIEAESPRGMEAVQGTLETTEQAGREHLNDKPLEKADTPPREIKERKKPVKTAKLTEPSDTPDKTSEAKKKGAAQSRAAKGSASAKGRVSASSGSAINYAALVRARVAARKPAGGGKRGTVVVAFGVTRSGGLAFASIARSSGDPGLDGKVLSAVRGVGSFPAPPPGAGLRFAIPFYFK
ncbi:energy transducer TonB [uncultured Hyphomicrobium sp.]|uniref:energy transducer TonB family protein n=1 Tax=uncultured Hyphomicrobium sp. TaxID=194373 RepID=UPI0025DEE5E2|nr:energy transducer TonB [uncultured Hyphomicrobium sp.]